MKSPTLIGTVTAFLIIFSSQQASSDESSQGGKETETILNLQKEVLTLQRQIDFLISPIKSRLDLENYLANNLVENTPLGRLPTAEREIFINSLVFSERGLAGFNFGVLEYGPTATEVFNILKLFGAQSLISNIENMHVASDEDMPIISQGTLNQLFVDYKDYVCISRATCKKATDHICTDNCYRPE
ncbi:hypothetical protein [Microbulbifer sp. 2205BS26-8]|uniref:hypothetical protein n=1 Tax=Microbulbifer sp. 2205BS26-8 TaxID=3064386 RepID=UPI00273D6E2C|nr:hypothetical protein [Microbulbifer sp. 2205BS26-8]MDP5210465.1 hypothetical protein [Microbulbifer sp. 2205BS26-8]